MAQCLIGPLLWVTESEISKKAERMTLKDLSQRDDTSSDVIPFVSIFGRIFNLMVPVEVKKKKKVRICLLHTGLGMQRYQSITVG